MGGRRAGWAGWTILAALLAVSCSSDSPRAPAGQGRCLYGNLFAGLAGVTGRSALCPRWLPDGHTVMTSYASEDPPAYTVEFGAIHVVLSFGADDLPGDPVQSVDLAGSSAKVVFNPAGAGQPGLHSGHYAVELPAPKDSRGAYSVSLHGIPWHRRDQNVRTLVRIAGSLTAVSTD